MQRWDQTQNPFNAEVYLSVLAALVVLALQVLNDWSSAGPVCSADKYRPQVRSPSLSGGGSRSSDDLSAAVNPLVSEIFCCCN